MMKRFLPLIFAAFALCGCVSSMDTGSTETTKTWIKIDSARRDLDGDIIDVCFRLDLRFSPPQAAYGFNTDYACITKCCWYGERRQVVINTNENFARALALNGRAIKYTPETITIDINYSSFFNSIHGRVNPKKAVKSGGLVLLEAKEIINDSK